jgi:hypothetical protein
VRRIDVDLMVLGLEAVVGVDEDSPGHLTHGVLLRGAFKGHRGAKSVGHVEKVASIRFDGASISHMQLGCN